MKNFITYISLGFMLISTTHNLTGMIGMCGTTDTKKPEVPSEDKRKIIFIAKSFVQKADPDKANYIQQEFIGAVSRSQHVIVKHILSQQLYKPYLGREHIETAKSQLIARSDENEIDEDRAETLRILNETETPSPEAKGAEPTYPFPTGSAHTPATEDKVPKSKSCVIL